MKEIKTIVITIFGIIASVITRAQDRPAESLSLISNVTTSNDLYNGTVNVNIPLYSIPIGNLQLYNELSNTPKGFDPRIDESIYGLHWYGNPFGQITRGVNKDFLLTKYFVKDPYVFGIVASDEIKNRERTDCTRQSQNFGNGNPSSKKEILFNPVNTNIQSSFIPDKFYFDFFGYRGYFVFDNKGKALVFCENANLKVLEPGYLSSNCYSVISPINFQNKNIREFRMIDDKGNTFYFGGDFDALEANYSEYRNVGLWNSNIGTLSYKSLSRANYIVSWYLKKIELGNGEIIIANYKHGNSSVFIPFVQETLINTNTGQNFPTSFPSQSELSQANVEVSQSRSILFGNAQSIADIQTYTKRAIIENIEVIGKNINVNYNYFRDTNGLIHLNGVNLNYFGKTENITLNQIPLGGQNYRYFLDSVTKNDQKYFFEYYKTDNLPNKNTGGINGYGFWNGTQYYGVGDGNTLIDATLLKKVVYPTKGYSIFNFEKGVVSKRANYDSQNSQPTLVDYPETPKLSKVRLASKIEFNDQQEYKTDYTYILDDGKSSGILNNTVYTQVQEKTQGKGMVEYFFSNYATNPDVNNIRKFNQNYFTSYEENRSYQRGKLLKRKIYDSTNKLIREHQYEYQNFLKPETELVDLELSNCNSCKISDENYYVKTDLDMYYTQNNRVTTSYIPVIPYLLKKEKVINYINGQEIVSETNTKYRESNRFWHLYPEEIESITPTETIIKRYLYAHDLRTFGCTLCPVNESIVGGQEPTYNTMIMANIMFPVIEIEKNGGNKYLLKENLFYNYPFIIKKVRHSKLNEIADFTNYNITVDKTVDDISYDLIDNRANYLQTTDKSNIPTVIIYGYHQTLPIAKITGLTYTQLMQILGQSTTSLAYLNLDIVDKSNLDIDAVTEQALINSLDVFRNNPLLKDYPVTTNTYDPLIGITSITPPSGIKEFYKYDTANRLEKIVDTNGKVLKEYKYKYKN